MTRDAIFSPLPKRSAALPAALKLPVVSGTTDTMLEFALRQRLRPEGLPEHSLGRMEALVLQLARVQNGKTTEFELLAFDSPQLVVFAADHGLADEGMSSLAPSMTEQMVMQLLRGEAPVNALAAMHGFELTVVDAGMAKPIAPPSDARQHGSLLPRKIGYGTRNAMLGPAMSTAQAVSAVHAGMDVVRHLPGNVIAVGDVGVSNLASAALLLSRLCGVPLVDAFGREEAETSNLDDSQHVKRVEKLSATASRHRSAVGPFEALAALGGFEIAMMAGAMLQAASERRVVLVDGYVSGAAALVARSLCPNVVDYLVFTHRAADAGHRLLLIHMQTQPLLDMGLRLGQGTGALMAWPMLLAAQRLLERQAVSSGR
jgi:nicotinate-nucleotide--dimethylbenzimidazole phosphoribosyltransferase